MRPILTALFTLGWATLLPGAAPTWKGDPGLAATELEQPWRQVANPAEAVGIRGLLRFALEAAGIGWHPERVTAALARARTLQDLDPASPTCGNFRWRSSDPRVLDLNAVEFALQLLGTLHVAHRGALNDEGRALLDALLRDGIGGLRRHAVRVDYTNIFLMQAWGLIAAGEALGQPEAAAEGYERLDRWLRHTALNGIGEYGGVTYYGTDLDSLSLLARFAGRPEARAGARAAQHLLWTDIAAHWWTPGDRLAGANSRSYDYLFGRGYLEAHTWTAGWLRERPELEGAGWLGGPRKHQGVFRDLVAQPPPADWTEPVRAQVPRTVVQRWGALPGQRAVLWLGHTASLASSGCSRGTDERTLVANLGDSPTVPQVILFMDGRGDPYGNRPTKGASGHLKALHLQPFIAAVQRGPELLQVLSLDPRAPQSRHRTEDLSCLLTHLTVPSAAEVWVDGRRVLPGTPAAPTILATGATVCLRLGQGVVAVRFLVPTAVDGSPARIGFVRENPGDAASRITVSHATTDPRGRGTVAVWMRVGDGVTDTAFPAWRATAGDAQVTASLEGTVARLAAGDLRLSADVARGERLELAGGEPEALLSVNGRDLGAGILAAYRKP